VPVADHFGRDPQAFGGEAWKNGGMPLAGGLHVERQNRAAVARKQNRGAFERRTARMFEHAGNPDAAIFSPPRRLALALLEAGIIRERHGAVEHGLEVAGVISGPGRGLVRHGGSPDEVSPAQPDGIDAGQARRFIDELLKDVIRLRAAGAAIGRGRNRVGEHAARADVDVLDVVHAGKATREINRLDIGADRADIGSHIGQVPHAQREKAPVLVERKFSFGEGVAGLSVG
jgi:hypothetical protein